MKTEGKEKKNEFFFKRFGNQSSFSAITQLLVWTPVELLVSFDDSTM